jgi:hypothetical protein
MRAQASFNWLFGTALGGAKTSGGVGSLRGEIAYTGSMKGLAMIRVSFVVATLGMLVLTGCGGSDEDDDGGAGGTSSSTGGSSGAGASASGGSTSSGGSASGGAGGSGVNAQPVGPVFSCFGECPLGECDNDMFWADVACSDVYEGPVGSETALCRSADNGGYCLKLGTDDSGPDTEYFAINCGAGESPTIAACERGCGIENEQARCL